MATVVPPRKQHKIPQEFMKTFQADVRFVPVNLPVAGYITFDRAMLASILRSQDPAVRERAATAIQSLDPAWEFVMVAPAEEAAAR